MSGDRKLPRTLSSAAACHIGRKPRLAPPHAPRRPVQISRMVVDSLVTVFFGNCRYGSVGGRQKKTDRLIPIVAETEGIVGRRNWYLKFKSANF
jgi:hypothetical protein